MDMCLRPLIHRDLERAPVLLRNVLPLQRRCTALFPAFRFLALLDVL